MERRWWLLLLLLLVGPVGCGSGTVPDGTGPRGQGETGNAPSRPDFAGRPVVLPPRAIATH